MAGFALVLLASILFANADDEIRSQILRFFPQADTDKDGVISDAEEAAARQQVLKRFPQVDRDGDGILSDAETKAVLRQAANRARQNKPARGTAQTAPPKQKPTHANVK